MCLCVFLLECVLEHLRMKSGVCLGDKEIRQKERESRHFVAEKCINQALASSVRACEGKKEWTEREVEWIEDGQVGEVSHGNRPEKGLVLGDGGCDDLEDILELKLDVHGQGCDPLPQSDDVLGVDVLCLAIGLLQLLLVFFNVGACHRLQSLQTLVDLGTHSLHNGHQGGLGLLHVGGHLDAHLLHKRLQLGPQGVHLGCVLGVVLVDDGVHLGAVLLNVLIDDIPQISAHGLDLGFQGLDVVEDGGAEVSGGVSDGGDDVVGDRGNLSLQSLDVVVHFIQALSQSVPGRGKSQTSVSEQFNEPATEQIISWECGMALLQLLVLGVIELGQGSLGTFLHLGQVDVHSGPDVGQLGGSISLQGSGMRACE